MPLTFLHLSDIHLRKEDLNTDDDLRNELSRDVARLQGDTGPFTGILVTGDIAYSGKTEEYERAALWLEGLCKQIGVPAENVWVVPGNHDVDVSMVRGDPALEDVRKHYRPAGGPLTLDAADALFVRHMSGPTYPNAFFRPLAAYNAFAIAYGWSDGCDTSASSVRWQQDFDLGDGSTLRLFGLNSALISDLSDSKGDNKLFVGSRQLTVPREEGVVNVMLCHHPPEWLLDSTAVNKLLVSRAEVQLFGHEHDHWEVTVNGHVQIFSGALHPDRGLGWQPRYNILSFEVDNDGEERILELKAWFRAYDRSATAFTVALGGTVRKTFRIPLAPWTSPQLTSTGGMNTSNVGLHARPSSRPALDPVVTSPVGPMPVPRTLRYRFHRLSHVTKTEIAVALHLIEEGDQALTALERTKVVLQRVTERGLTDQLRDQMDRHTAAP